MSSTGAQKVEPLDDFEDLDDLTELINRAQAIIDENRRRTSRLQALEILCEPAPVLIVGENVQQLPALPVPPAREPRQPNNDDDVVFVACEQNPIIDLRTPDTIQHKRRRRQPNPVTSHEIEVIDAPVTNIPASESTRRNTCESPRRNTSPNCPICLDNCKKATSTLCGHIFCENCIKQAIRATHKCPICKRKLSPKAIHPVYI